MTRIFTEEWRARSCDRLQIDNCQVVAHRTEEKNGYTCCSIGAGTAKVKRTQSNARSFCRSKS